jgi:hypothetical protein
VGLGEPPEQVAGVEEVGLGEGALQGRRRLLAEEFVEQAHGMLRLVL